MVVDEHLLLRTLKRHSSFLDTRKIHFTPRPDDAAAAAAAAAVPGRGSPHFLPPAVDRRVGPQTRLAHSKGGTS